MISRNKSSEAYKTIGEVTKDLGLVDKKTGNLQTHTIRYWEKQFRQIKPDIRAGKRRYYSKKTYKKMRFSLMLVDLFVWMFYLSKGFLVVKIKAELDVKRNRELIEKKYLELENKKIISDMELIKKFPDEIFVPTNVSQQSMNVKFNSILTKLSKKVKEEII